MFAGGDPETGRRFLEKKGFDAKQLEGFNYAIKKKGTREPWRVFDPERFEAADITDVAGDVLGLGGMIAGGAAGTAFGGGIGGVGGAAAGSGGAQALRTGIGAALGMEPTAGEVAGPVAEEAFYGGTAEFGGRLLGKATRAVGKKFSKGELRAAQTGLQEGEIQAAKVAATPQTKKALEALRKLPPEEEFVAKFTPRTVIRTPAGDVITGTRTMVGMKGIPESPLVRKQSQIWAKQLGVEGGREGLEKLGVQSAGLKTVDDVADAYYRYQVGGLKGIGLKYDPAKKALLGPVVDAERWAAQGLLGQVPKGAEKSFFRMIPLEGLRSLTIGGKEYVLSQTQARGMRAMITGLATGKWFGQSRHVLGRVLRRVSQALRLPRTALLEFIKWTRLGFLQRFLRAPGGGVAGAAGAGLLGGPAAGGAAAGIVGLDIAGRGIGRLSEALMADTTGNMLRTLAPRFSGRLGRMTGRAMQHAAAGNGMGYRATLFQLLHYPDFREALTAREEPPQPMQDRGRRPVIP
jgi:hypothetical protein